MQPGITHGIRFFSQQPATKCVSPFSFVYRGSQVKRIAYNFSKSSATADMGKKLFRQSLQAYFVRPVYKARSEEDKGGAKAKTHSFVKANANKSVLKFVEISKTKIWLLTKEATLTNSPRNSH